MSNSMKILINTMAAMAVVIVAVACKSTQKNTYALKEVIEVAGRQGVACDGEFYYVSGSTALYKYDMQGNLVLSNESPFDALELAANHIGDIDVHDGEIYAGIEMFMDGVGTNIQAAVYSAEDLTWKRSINWVPESGQVEVCGLAVDAADSKLYMADWVCSDYLYRYDLSTGEYEGKVELTPAPTLVQGIAVHDAVMYISCDDGDAENDEADNIRCYDVARSSEKADVAPFMLMTEFRRCGEIEGMCFNPLSDEMIVLSNRGARIILGMPRGFYPGYDREIHELYVFAK